jgi:hypothetical protein
MTQTTWEEFDILVNELKADSVHGRHPPMVVYRAVDPHTFAPKYIFISENGKKVAEMKAAETNQLEWSDWDLNK